MKNVYKVEGVPNLYKNIATGAFINRNEIEIESARTRKESRNKKKREEQALRDRVEEMSLQLNRIESMFQQLLEK